MKELYSKILHGRQVKIFVDDEGLIRSQVDGHDVAIKGLGQAKVDINNEAEVQSLKSKIVKRKIILQGQVLEVEERELGGWGDEVHSGTQNKQDEISGTYYWVKEIFNLPILGRNERAEAIATACKNVDYGLMTNPVTNQGRHFNVHEVSGKSIFSTTPGGRECDSRIIYALQSFENAIMLRRPGNLSDPYEELGKGLHSLQDVFAHDDAYVSSKDFKSLGKMKSAVSHICRGNFFYYHTNKVGKESDNPFHIRRGYFRDYDDLDDGSCESVQTSRYYDTKAATYIYFTMFFIATAKDKTKIDQSIARLNHLLAKTPVVFHKLEGFLQAFKGAERNLAALTYEPLECDRSELPPTAEQYPGLTKILRFGYHPVLTEEQRPALPPSIEHAGCNVPEYEAYLDFYHLSAFLAEDNIPKNLLTTVSAKDTNLLEEWISILNKYGFERKETREDCISIAPHLQSEVIRRILAERDANLAFINNMLTGLIELIKPSKDDMLEDLIYYSHLERLINNIKKYQVDASNIIFVEANYLLGVFCQGRYFLKKAQTAYETALDVFEKLDGTQQRQSQLLIKRNILFKLGSLSFDQHDDYPRAKERLEQALELHNLLFSDDEKMKWDIQRHIGAANIHLRSWGLAINTFRDIIEEIGVEKKLRIFSPTDIDESNWDEMLHYCMCLIDIAFVKAYQENYEEVICILEEKVLKYLESENMQRYKQTDERIFLKLCLAKLALGKAYHRKNNLEGAGNQFEFLVNKIDLSKYPSLLAEYIHSCYKLALIEQTRGNPQKAIDCLNKALATKETINSDGLFLKESQQLYDELISTTAIPAEKHSESVVIVSDPNQIHPGLQHQIIRGDGDCLYRAVTCYLTHGEDVEFLRERVAANLKENAARLGGFAPLADRQTLQEYINNIRSTHAWANNLEINILMRLLNSPIVIIGPEGTVRNIDETNQHQSDPIFIYYNDRDHYDVLFLRDGFDGRTVLGEILQPAHRSEDLSAGTAVSTAHIEEGTSPHP
ncbi:MAG: hypothetical protein KAT71_00775 [Gammaproteobacteria bacterium]|nr:hypothetical protein [Gammaproteobacteria bacterium]